MFNEIETTQLRMSLIAFFERIDIWKTNEFLSVQREFETGVEY